MEIHRGTSGRRRTPSVLMIGAALLALGLGGCASLAASQSFDLHAAPAKARRTNAKFVVATPNATPPLDGDLIVVRSADGSLSRVPDVKWADRLPVLLQSRTVQTFENAGLARQVMASGESADYRLRIEVRRFDIDAATRKAEVELTARLVAEGSGQVVAAKVFSGSAPVPEIAGGIPPQALDYALGTVLVQLVGWAAASVR